MSAADAPPRPAAPGGEAPPRRGPRLALAATAAAAALLAAGALALSAGRARPAPPRGGFVLAVEAGFDRGASSEAPSPVAVTLTNPRDRELALRVVATSQSVRAEEEVTLLPGARRRVALAIRVTDEVLVDVLDEAGAVLDRGVVADLDELAADRHLLAIDGRPPDRRTAGGTHRAEPVLRLTSIEPEAAPSEAACYAAFGAVLLRGGDLAAWPDDPRQALLEHVQDGGTLLLVDASPKDPAAQRLFDGLAGPATSAKLCGRAARQKALGLGRVIAFPDDVLQAALAGDERAADVRQRLGDLVQEAQGGRDWPRQGDAVRSGLLEGPGATTRALVGAFLLAYVLAVGPGLGLALRRAPRRRLALATVGLVLGFTLLTPVVAGLVTHAPGVAFVRTTAWVPRAGPAVEVGEVVVASGGASRYDLALVGRRVAASVVVSASEREGRWTNNGMEWTPERPTSLATRRGDPAALRVAMPPWGTRRVLVHLLRDDLRPVEAVLRRTAQGAQALIVNTSGAPLARAVIIGDDTMPTSHRGFVELGTLEPGARRTVELPRTFGVAAGDRHRVVDALEVPEAWLQWQGVAPARASGEAAGGAYRLVSRLDPGVRVEAGGLAVEAHAVRVDAFTAAFERGHAGLVVEEAPPPGAVPYRVRVVRVAPGSPAAEAGIAPGALLVSVGDQPVSTVAHLRSVLARHLPGERLGLAVWDPATGRVERLEVRLAPRGAVAEGD